MKALRHSLLPLPPVPRALRTLDRLDEKAVLRLVEEIHGPEGFEISRLRRIEDLADQLGLESATDASSLLSSLEFLYERAHDSSQEGAPGDHSTRLKEFLLTSGLWSFLGEDADRSFDKLSFILSGSPTIDERRKRAWLETGVLPNAVSFASFVDLRPNYTSDRSDLAGLIPVVIFQIITETALKNEQELIYQVTENGLTQLKMAVNDAVNKLRALREHDRIRKRTLGELLMAATKA